MFYSTLFYLVFLSQIIVISFYFPRKLVKQASQSAATNGTHDIDKKLLGYTRANHLIVVLGLGLLGAFIFFDMAESVTAVLASIGCYYLLQLSPLAIPAIRQLMSDMKVARAKNDTHRKPAPDTPHYDEFHFTAASHTGV